MRNKEIINKESGYRTFCKKIIQAGLIETTQVLNWMFSCHLEEMTFKFDIYMMKEERKNQYWGNFGKRTPS